MKAEQIGVTPDGKRLWTVLASNWGKETRENIKPFVSSYDSIASRPNDNSIHKTKLVAGPTKSHETQLIEFRTMRKREMILLQKSFIRGQKQLCIYVKRDKLHKALVAIVCFDKRGTVWFDITADYKLRFRCIIESDSVSQKIMRYQLGLENNAQYSVYAQEIKSAIAGYIGKRKHNSRRAYNGVQSTSPHDRKPQKFTQKGKPESTWILEREYLEER